MNSSAPNSRSKQPLKRVGAGCAGRAASVLALATAASALPHPSRAPVRLSFTESEAAKYGLQDRYRRAIERRERKIERRATAAAELEHCVTRLFALASLEKWSLRKLAARAGIPERTFRRIRDHQVNPLVWLPILQTARARFNPTELYGR